MFRSQTPHTVRLTSVAPAIAAFAAIALMAFPSHALSLGFELIPGVQNSADADLPSPGQLTVEITDGGTFASFQFENNVGNASSITDIYFDDDCDIFLWSTAGFTSTDGVSFSEGANPPNLPGGNTLVPAFDADYSLDSVARGGGVSGNGIDAASESLTLTADYQAGVTFDDLLACLTDESFRIGLHVQSIGDAGTSDSFVNLVPDDDGPNIPGGDPIPEPATVGLLGLGAAAMALRSRKTKF